MKGINKLFDRYGEGRESGIKEINYKNIARGLFVRITTITLIMVVMFVIEMFYFPSEINELTKTEPKSFVINV